MMAPNSLRAVLLLGLLPLGVISSPAASTLYLDQKQTEFSINVANDSNDTYFHFESPFQDLWVAVGVGAEMKGALMFIMYPSKDNQHVTFSPRLATGTIEPTYSSDIQVDILDGSGIPNGRLILNAVCHNCRSWNGGSLDVTSTAQPWIYAFGPVSNPVKSDSLTADLTQHAFYGKFTMNMTQATGPGGVPLASSTSSGVTLTGQQYIADGDDVSVTHGYVMGALVLLIAPILVLHLFTQARLRWITYTVFVLVALVGFAGGFYDSTYYNRSKNFNSPHQIMGYVVLIGLFILVVYRILSRFGRGSNALIGSSEIFVGIFVWILALVNGFFGIKLADSKRDILIIYGCLIIAMIVSLGPLMWIVKRIRNRRARRKASNRADVVPLS